jgi:hypothetical protein
VGFDLETTSADVGSRSLRDLWADQCRWHRAWADGFERWLRGQKAKDGATFEEITAIVIDRDWPLRPHAEAVTV